MVRWLSLFVHAFKSGAEPFTQAGYIVSYNVLQGLEHLSISTITETKIA
jgi:hypothetical protein